MASISAKNVSIVYPLVGPDKRFTKGKRDEKISVGGRIIRGQNSGILALDNFSVELKDGDRLGIFGHNGSGKSTLLRLLGGIYPPTKGTIEINGTTAGMFSLTLGVNKEATGLQNIEFKGLMRGMSRREITDIVPRIAEFSELGDYLHLPVKTYSSGMVMRLMFATASMMKPDILLLDEWVSAGDNAFREKADEHLQEILETTRIVIIASQNETRLRHWSNKLVFLKNGKILPTPDATPLVFKADREIQKEYNKLMNLRHYDKALDMVDAVWPKEIVPALNLQNLGTLYQRLDRPDDALKAYKKALTLDDNNAALHNTLGVMLSKMGKSGQAFKHIFKALELSDGTVGNISILKHLADEGELTENQKSLYSKMATG